MIILVQFISKAGSLVWGLVAVLSRLLVIGIISAIFALLIDAFAPERVRQPIQRYIRRVKKWASNPDVKVSMTTSYALDESVELDEISGNIRSDFSTYLRENDRDANLPSSKIGDHFESRINTSRGDLMLDITMEPTPGTPARNIAGEAGLETKTGVLQVSTLRVTATIDTKYRDLRGALELCNEYIDIDNIINQYSLTQNVYNGTVEMESPSQIDHFMALIDIEELKAENDKLEIKFEKESIQVRNVGKGTVPDVFDKIVELVVYYG